MFDIKEIPQSVSILNQQVNGKPLIYLDNAAFPSKPISVLETWQKYYEEINANVHRGIHTLSHLAKKKWRILEKSSTFYQCKHDYEVIFTKWNYQGIANLIAYSLGNSNSH